MICNDKCIHQYLCKFIQIGGRTNGKTLEAVNKAYQQGWNDAIDAIIDNAPTVDTTCPNCDSGYAQGYSDGYLKGKEARPQGKWVYGNLDHSTCSNCNYFNHYGDLPFCPNCGAEMAKNGE